MQQNSNILQVNSLSKFNRLQSLILGQYFMRVNKDIKKVIISIVCILILKDHENIIADIFN